jgi:hypothetical protein
MEEVHRAADSLFTSVDRLDRVIGDEMTQEAVPLALSLAKRVRRESAALVQSLAAQREVS